MIIGVPAKLADYLLAVWALVVAVHLNVLCHQLFLLRLPFLTRSDELNPLSRGSWPRSPSDKKTPPDILLQQQQTQHYTVSSKTKPRPQFENLGSSPSAAIAAQLE